MAAHGFDDFRLTLRAREDGTYATRAMGPDGAVHDEEFRLPFPPGQLERAVLGLASRVAQSRSTSVTAVRDVHPSGRPAFDAEELGGALATALLAGGIGPAYDHARATAAGDGRGLRLTLSLRSAPALLSVPWELMYRRPRFLANQRLTPFVRHLDVPVADEPPAITGPVYVLGVIASPDDCTPLDVAVERERVERAVATERAAGRIVLDWLDPATPRGLRQALRDGAYHVLHFVGHSDFTDDEEGVLYLEDGVGGHALVDGTALANLLADQSTLRLVVLNSCEGARTTLADPFAGVATTLIELGVPAVVAMQFEISDGAAILFAEELYTNLVGRHAPIDVAVAEARKAIYIEQGSIEWATPVLFMADPDAELFRFAEEPTDRPTGKGPGDRVVSPSTGSPSTAAATRLRRSGRRLALTAGAAGLVAIGALVAGQLGSDADDDGSTPATTVAADEDAGSDSAATAPSPTAAAPTAAPSPAAATPAGAPPPVEAQSFTGTISDADGRAAHPLELTAGQLLYLDSPSPCGPQVSYRLVPPSGTGFGGAPTVCAAMGRVEIPETGTWTVLLQGYGGGRGAYVVDVRPIPPDTETEVAVDEPITGEITAPGERHVAAFEATSGDLVYLGGSGACGSLTYALRAPSDTQLGGAPTTCADVGRQQLTETGRYRIVIGGGGGRGSYDLTLFAVPADRIEAVDVGGPLRGELTVPGEEHRFTFTATAGDRVPVDGLGPCGPLVRFQLWSPSGVRVGGAPYTCNDLDSQVLGESGEYSLVISGLDDAVGAYDVMLLPGG